MANKGFGVAARLRWLLKPATTLPPLTPRPLLPPDTHANSPPSLLLRTIATPAVISVHEQRQVFMGWRFQRLFSTSSIPSPQEASPDKSSTGGENAPSFREFMSSVATAPMMPMFLTITGAVPFLVLTPPFPYVVPLPEILAANPIESQTLYGAVILSSLGGPHWGLAMVGIKASQNHKIFSYASNHLRYVWSIVPPLLAWPALLMATVPKLEFLICSFGLALAVDIIFARHGLMPPWYLPLRLLASGIVILCLTASLFEVLLAQKLESKDKGQ